MAGKINPNLWNMIIPVDDPRYINFEPKSRNKLVYDPDAIPDASPEPSLSAVNVGRRGTAQRPEGFSPFDPIKSRMVTEAPRSNCPDSFNQRSDSQRQSSPINIVQKSSVGPLILMGIAALIITVFILDRRKKRKQEEERKELEKLTKERSIKSSESSQSYKTEIESNLVERFMNSELGKTSGDILYGLFWLGIIILTFYGVKAAVKAAKKLCDEVATP